MSSKLLEFFTYYINLPLKNNFFQVLSTALRKLTTNDKNQDFLGSKNEKKKFFNFFRKKNSNIISKLSDDFSEDFFEVLHIYVGQKIMILENCLARVLIFSRYASSFLKSSNFELQKSETSQKKSSEVMEVETAVVETSSCGD